MKKILLILFGLLAWSSVAWGVNISPAPLNYDLNLAPMSLAYLLNLSEEVDAAEYTSATNGDWSTLGTWEPYGIPGVGDTVTITTHNITLIGDVTL